jgi:hypothetical protein
MKRIQVYAIKPVLESRLLGTLEHVIDPSLVRVVTNLKAAVTPMGPMPALVDERFEFGGA